MQGEFQILNKHVVQYAETAENQGSLYILLVDTFSVILVVRFNRPAVRKLFMFMLKALHTKMLKEYSKKWNTI